MILPVRDLPKSLTSYDVLKSLALILMIIDHIGYHFFPEEEWFRVLGRLCIPIWFFLVGYARTTEIPTTFWLGALLVVASAMVAGQYLLPLNILFTIMIARSVRPKLAVAAVQSPEALRGMFFILLLLSLPTSVVFEYGAAGLFFVLFGFIMRHYDYVQERIAPKFIKLYVAASFVAFYILEAVPFPELSVVQALVLGAGLAVVAIMLWLFKSAEYKGARKYMAGSVIGALQLFGRHTLFIYVVHILIFRGVSMVYNPERFAFLEWDIAPFQMVAAFL